MDEINRLISTLDLRNTRLQRRMLDSASARRDAENISTPADMARVMEMIYHGKVVDEGTSREMQRILKLVDADIVKGVPAGVEVAAKPGELTGVRCEAAIVYHPKRPFALAVMSTYLTAGENPVGQVAHILYEHFDRLGKSNRYGNRVE
jgi:beta-lactamase class A